jgi:hypothetical protein
MRLVHRKAHLTYTNLEQLYFEHADEFAPLLNIKKSKKKAARASKKPAVSMVSRFKFQCATSLITTGWLSCLPAGSLSEDLRPGPEQARCD